MDQSQSIDLVSALVAELQFIEDQRFGVINDLLDVCRAMRAIQVRLGDGMLQMLLEEKWREGEVTKSLAEATALLMKAIKGIEKGSPYEIESEARRRADAIAWTEEVAYRERYSDPNPA